MELIYADSSFNEMCEVTCFVKFDAQIGLKTENADNDFELVMDENVWVNSPVRCGGYLYLSDTVWGGRIEKIVHSVSEEKVRIYGTCFRGLLEHYAVVPNNGDTHVVVEEKEANRMLADFLSDGPSYIKVDTADSGILCSGAIRYKSLLSAAETLLSKQGARLHVSFENGSIMLRAERITDHTNEIEFSQEYDSSLVSTEQDEIYNHIIALGQGKLEERDIVELWRLPDGTVTNNSSAQDILQKDAISTYIYDYSGVESRDALEEAARRKLSSMGKVRKLEISIDNSEVCLELSDIAGVRDLLTGMTATLTVTAIRLVIEENSVKTIHTLS